MYIKYVVQNVSYGRPYGLLSSSFRWNLKSILRSYYFPLPFAYDAFLFCFSTVSAILFLLFSPLYLFYLYRNTLYSILYCSVVILVYMYYISGI